MDVFRNMTLFFFFVSKDKLILFYMNQICLIRHRECPEDCKEAVSSLMFAAARFADLPELREMRTLFLENYGDCVNSYANKEVSVVNLNKPQEYASL